MKSVRVGIVALLVAAAVGVGAAWARPAVTPTATITAANAKLRELAASNRPDALREITMQLRDLFDINDLAKRALVDHWEKMSAAQRTKLVDTLRLILEKNYVSQVKDNLGYSIETKGEEPQGDDVLVHTVIHAKRNERPVEIPIDYLLHPDGDHWKAVDVVTDGVGLIANYRSQFNRIIKKEGVDGLIARMKAKLDKDGAGGKDVQ